jgi:hypothetical protein
MIVASVKLYRACNQLNADPSSSFSRCFFARGM